MTEPTTVPAAGSAAHVNANAGAGVGEPPDLARSLRRHLEHAGGFTLDDRTFRPMHRGVSVGADPSATLHLPWAQWSDELVAWWVGRHADRRRRDGLHLGGWFDVVRGEVWLDLVQVYPESAREEAVRAGLRLHQHAVFDIGARTLVCLAGLTATSADAVVVAHSFGAIG